MKIILIILAVFISAPFFVVAQSQTDLQVQAQALMEKITQLQAQFGTQNGAAQATPGNTININGTPAILVSARNVDSSACPQIGRVLKLGTRGEDVSRLQQYLARDSVIYPIGTISGYYGALTEAAVKRWQVKYNIVGTGSAATTGYGVVGPRTAAAIALLCSTGGGGGGTSNATIGGYITISPVGGNAPLTVQAQAVLNTTNLCGGVPYTLNWGDGSQSVVISVPADKCTHVAQNLSHVYQYGGTYQITLASGAHSTNAVVTVYGASAPSAPSVSSCQAGYILKNGQCEVGNNSETYSPLSVTPGVNGSALSVNISFDVPGCGSYTMSWGDGTPQIANASSCSSGTTSSTQTLSHTYTGAGSYTITVTRNNRTDTASITLSN